MGSRQIVMKELLEQVPPLREKKVFEELRCRGCKYFPLTGKSEHYCTEAGARVRANDIGCIFFEERKNKRVSGTSKPTILPREMWEECRACGRYLKTAESIKQGIGSGCKRKREKEEKK